MNKKRRDACMSCIPSFFVLFYKHVMIWIKTGKYAQNKSVLPLTNCRKLCKAPKRFEKYYFLWNYIDEIKQSYYIISEG